MASNTGISWEFHDYSKSWLSTHKDQVKQALTACGMAAETYAKKECPVDTGNLRNSITYEVQDNTMHIGTNVEYGMYVEIGTSHSKAQPYLKPAIADHVDRYQSIIRTYLGKEQ